MSSKYVLSSQLNAKRIDMNTVPRNIESEAILFNTSPSLYQDQIDSNFTPANNILPGQYVTNEIKFNANENRLDHYMYARFQVKTTDAVNSLIAKYDAYSFISKIVFETNKSPDKLEFNGTDEIFMNMRDHARDMYSKGHDIDIYQSLTEFRQETNTLNGVTVTSASPQYFYLPLGPFIPFLMKMITYSVCDTLRITMYFVAQNTADEMYKCGIASTTTSNAYTTASVSFNDISFYRKYLIVRDLRTVATPPLNTILQQISRYDTVRYVTPWNAAGIQYSFKLSDQSKQNYIQRIHAFVRPIATAFNDAGNGLYYSGYQNIVWSLSELNGDRRTLSFLNGTFENARRARSFEIEYNRAYWGGKDLPAEILASSTQLDKTFINRTVIPFDMTRIDQWHDDFVNSTSTVDRNTMDYNVVFQCPGTQNAALTSATSCELIILIEYYDFYKWGTNGTFNKIKRLGPNGESA